MALPFGSHRDTGAPDLSRCRFTPISVDAPTEREPAWAPDGNRIAYVASINGVLQVMTRTLGGAQAAQLTHRATHAERPFWSPDGSTIYFTTRADDGAGMWLWSVNATGGTPERVIEGATSAAVHPDGRTFAFTKDGKLWTDIALCGGLDQGLITATRPSQLDYSGCRLAMQKLQGSPV